MALTLTESFVVALTKEVQGELTQPMTERERDALRNRILDRCKAFASVGEEADLRAVVHAREQNATAFLEGRPAKDLATLAMKQRDALTAILSVIDQWARDIENA